MRLPIFCLSAAILAGCSSFSSDVNTTPPKDFYKPQLHKDSIQFYSQRIANQLYQSLRRINSPTRIAVGTFTPVNTLVAEQNKASPTSLLGQQIQEGMMTASVQYGFTVVEFKTQQNVTIAQSSDLMLSRKLHELTTKQNIDYFITGTLTEQEQSVVVNARLIDVRNQHVIAAATDYVPNNVFWSSEKVKLRQGDLYRSQN